MSKKPIDKATQLEQGRNLARHLYDLSIKQLEQIDESQRESLLAQFPLLGAAEFNDVRRQVLEAKAAERMRVGWFTIPHDVTVLVFVLVTGLVSLQAGIIAATAVLVLLESIFQVTFDPKIYPRLSWLVWLTYPAYVVLAWILYTRSLAWYWIILVLVGAWAGIFLAGMIARLPMQLILKSKQQAASRKPGRKSP